LSNIFSQIFLSAAEEGGMDEEIWKNKTLRRGVYMYNGSITNRYIAEVCKLPFKDLDLLRAARL
jgi:alanine dehydrogenase